MSLFSDERAPIKGANITGNGVTYTLAPTQRFRLETITFVLTCNSTVANRNPQVVLKTQDGSMVAAIPDWNDVPASAVVTYTFGIGLAAFCGIGSTGGFIRAELPDTVLEPEATVSLESRNASTGAVLPSDTFTSVVLYGIPETPSTSADVIPLLTPIALSEQGDATAVA